MFHDQTSGNALLDPNQVEGKRFGSLSLLDIRSDEWNRKTGRRLEAQR